MIILVLTKTAATNELMKTLTTYLLEINYCCIVNTCAVHKWAARA